MLHITYQDPTLRDSVSSAEYVMFKFHKILTIGKVVADHVNVDIQGQ